MFRWRVLRTGVLEIIGIERLQLNEAADGVEREASCFSFAELPYRIADEVTAAKKRMTVLRLNLGADVSDHYGLMRRDYAGCEEPMFSVR